MGQLLEAECACGFRNKDITFGGVKSNFRTVCDVPAINILSGQLEVVNLYDHRIKTVATALPQQWYEKLLRFKPKYVRPTLSISNKTHRFYNDSGLRSTSSSLSMQIASFDFVMYERENYCPACKNFTLNFKFIAMTD